MIVSTKTEVPALAREAPCPIVRFNALTGGKHKLRILWELRGGARRYSEVERGLREAMGPGASITPRVLSRELRQLAGAGLIARRQYPVIPPRVEYRLTGEGRALLGVMRAVCRWGERAG
jgi:DNA-binding HxlR family transcriptional regulator